MAEFSNNDDDEWPYIDCSLDTYFSATKITKAVFFN